VSSPSPVPENGSIVSFQFFQQRGGNGRFMGQTLGTNFEFPHDGVFLAGKLLRPKMFIIYTSQHYLVVLCVGESFFLSNSLSASQCGHFLPETREISEQDAMELFRTQAHTIVFECVGNFWPPPIQPYPSVSDTWFPPPPPAQCAPDHWVPSPPPPVPCAQVAQALPQSEPTFSFNDGRFEHQKGFPLSRWTYTYDRNGTVCFKAEGTFQDEQYSERKYFYNGREYCRFLIQTVLRDACVEFLKANLLPK
jgi:hypothetical protein